ncbi:MAG: hypothetical protein QXE32_06320 [Sulfolobales archaeon]
MVESIYNLRSERIRMNKHICSNIVIGMRKDEESYRRLSEALESIVGFWDVILLPLPRDLCRDLVLKTLERRSDGSILESLLERYPNQAFRRMWKPLLLKILGIAEDPIMWRKDLVCYISDDHIRRTEERGFELAYLLFRANTFGRVDEREWLRVFRRSEENTLKDLVREYLTRGSTAIITDSYTDFIEFLKPDEVEDYCRCALTDLIPTPLEVLELISLRSGEDVEADLLRDSVKWSIDYLNMVVTSIELSEAYEWLLKNDRYRIFLERLGLHILHETCQSRLDLRNYIAEDLLNR